MDELVPTQELLKRYQLDSEVVLRNWFRLLGIEPEQQGHTTYVTPAQVEQLDDLARHLKMGGTFTSYPGVLSLVCVAETDEDPFYALEDDENDTLPPDDDVTLLSLTEAELVAILQELGSDHRSPDTDPLRPYRLLDEAARHGWPIAMADLKRILNRSGSIPDGYEFSCWRFTRIGKQNGQIMLRVKRLPAM
jgi:hypothetical protein